MWNSDNEDQIIIIRPLPENQTWYEANPGCLHLLSFGNHWAKVDPWYYEGQTQQLESVNS